MPGQQPFNQIIGAQKIGLIAQVAQHLDRLRMARVIAQRLPQETFATMGQVEELIRSVNLSRDESVVAEIEAALRGMLKPVYEEVQLGTAEVREVFKSSKFGTIAGCLVRSGEIRRNTKARLVRDGAVVANDLSIATL